MTQAKIEAIGHLREHMAQTIAHWLVELKRGYFDDPYSKFADTLTMEAVAAALVMIHPPATHKAVLETHIIELQELLNPNPVPNQGAK